MESDWVETGCFYCRQRVNLDAQGKFWNLADGSYHQCRKPRFVTRTRNKDVLAPAPNPIKPRRLKADARFRAKLAEKRKNRPSAWKELDADGP